MQLPRFGTWGGILRYMTTRTELAGLVIAGLTAAYALGDPRWWPLAVLSAAFFFHVLNGAARPLSGLRAASVYGFTLVGGSIHWFLSAASHAGTGIENSSVAFALAGSAWLISTITLGAPFALAGYAYVRLKRDSWTDIPLGTCIFVLAEFLRPFTFGIQTLAPESLFGAHWTFGSLGYALAGSPILLQGAAVGGVYLLSAIIFFLSAALAHIYRRRFVPNMRLGVGVLIIAPLLSFPFSPADIPQGVDTRTIVALKVTEPAYFSAAEIDREARLDRMEILIQNALHKHPDTDLVVLPEDSRFITLAGADRLAAIFSFAGATLIDSSRVETGARAHSRIVTHSSENGTQLHYTKRMLVPEGEYLSYLYRGILRLAGMQEALERYRRVKAYTPGSEPALTTTADISIAASLCSELYSPHLTRELAEDAHMIVNLASLSRFRGLPAVDGQNRAMARVRAVENRRYLARATNFGTAYIIDYRGTVIAESAPEESFAAVAATVPLRFEKTAFSRVPYAVPLIALALVSYLWRMRCRERNGG